MTYLAPGYSRVTFTWTFTGSTRFFQTNVDVRNLLNDGSPDVVCTNVRTAFTSGVINAGNMFTGFTLTNVKCLMKTSGGVLLTYDDPTPIVGTKTGAGMSVNTSVLVKKQVSQAGRAYRGRMMLPPLFFLESDISVLGIISSTAVYQGYLTTAWTYMSTRNPVVLLHSDPLLTPTVVNGLLVQPKIGTIGKRMRG